jgi:hypothetical protein
VGPGETGIIVVSEPTSVPSEGEGEEEGSQAEQGQQQHLTWEEIIGW